MKPSYTGVVQVSAISHCREAACYTHANDCCSKSEDLVERWQVLDHISSSCTQACSLSPSWIGKIEPTSLLFLLFACNISVFDVLVSISTQYNIGIFA